MYTKEDEKEVTKIICKETRDCNNFKDWVEYVENYDRTNKKNLFPMLAQTNIYTMVEACLMELLLKHNLLFEEMEKFWAQSSDYYRITFNREYGNYFDEKLLNEFIKDLNMDFKWKLIEHTNTKNKYLEYVIERGEL